MLPERRDRDSETFLKRNTAMYAIAFTIGYHQCKFQPTREIFAFSTNPWLKPSDKCLRGNAS